MTIREIRKRFKDAGWKEYKNLGMYEFESPNKKSVVYFNPDLASSLTIPHKQFEEVAKVLLGATNVK